MSTQDAYAYELGRVLTLGEDLVGDLHNRLPEDAQVQRIDQLAVVGIVTYLDEDGDECEAAVWAFETRALHIRHGIVTHVLHALRGRWFG